MDTEIKNRQSIVHTSIRRARMIKRSPMAEPFERMSRSGIAETKYQSVHSCSHLLSQPRKRVIFSDVPFHKPSKPRTPE